LTHFPFGLGFMGELGRQSFAETTLALDSGDVLFIASDGVTEAARGGDATQGMFGEPALVELIAAYGDHPIADMRAALVERLEAFTGGVYHDDVSFVIVRAAFADDA
ncbi:MAG: SpoIIE family protein phosphatase, partial [Gemmatimonadaceae bacterium]